MLSKVGLVVILLFLQVHSTIAVRCRLSISISPLVAFMYLLWHQRPSISSSFSTTCLCRSVFSWNIKIKWCNLHQWSYNAQYLVDLTGQTDETAKMDIFQKQMESIRFGHYHSKLECIICVCQEDDPG